MKFTCVPAISKSSFRKEGDRRKKERKETRCSTSKEKKKKGKQQTTKLKKGLGKIDVSISLSLSLVRVCLCVFAHVTFVWRQKRIAGVWWFISLLPSLFFFSFLSFSFTKGPWLFLSLQSFSSSYHFSQGSHHRDGAVLHILINLDWELAQ